MPGTDPFRLFTDRLERANIPYLEYYREGGSEKHLRDIAAMLDVSGDRIDQEEIAAQARDLGLEGQWAAAKKLSGG